MSRLFRFLLLPAGAGAMVAFSRRNREEPQPFFADARPAQDEPVMDPRDAEEPVSEFRSAWSPAEAAVLPEEEPFVAELPATPFPADDAPDDPSFVADLREPDRSSAQTDTWSGRAIGS